MSNTTVIYYTANTEDEVFEQKIKDNIMKNKGDLPLISVSRKPIDFGENICVGEKDVCYSNSFRQLLLGLKAAKTEFCIAAESDVLYPPEYFQFTPPTDKNVYRYDNIWVMFDKNTTFYKKKFSEGTQMCGREYWIKQIERALEGTKEWEPLPNKPVKLIFDTGLLCSWGSDNPAITFKTRNGVSYRTGLTNIKSAELPYWGSGQEVREKYLL